jgi:hypothetical protein
VVPGREGTIETEIITTDWGVANRIDGPARITECASEQAAREYQKSHGGHVVSREVYHYADDAAQDAA